MNYEEIHLLKLNCAEYNELNGMKLYINGLQSCVSGSSSKKPQVNDAQYPTGVPIGQSFHIIHFATDTMVCGNN